MAGPYFDGGVAGESAEIVRNEGVGCVFEPENAAQLAALLLRLQDDPATLAAYRQRGSAAATAQAATTERRWHLGCLMS